MKLSAVKYLSDAILSQRYEKDIFYLHDIIQNAYLIENELLQEISDEQIEEEARTRLPHESTQYADGFVDGANWYKEQLKNK